jgi:glycosyltransferase involved in cell wall biosynthesis
MVAIRTRPGIILIGHPHFGPLGWILARISRVPMFTFMYGIDVWSTLPLLRRSALRRSDRAIAISQFTATNAITANALSPNKLRILGNCLDPQFEQPAKQDTNTTTLSLLTVARILTSEQYKGHEQVIRTMPFLLERFPELIYNIVGDGDGRSQMEDVARQEGVEHAVKFHGSVSDTELKKHYREATLFVMPSRREGFGFVFLEAMAHGLPIVAGDQDATTEVVQDGKTGILVNPLSTYALHAAITRLLTQAEERRQMGLRGAEAVDSFSYPAFRATMTSYINEVLR